MPFAEDPDTEARFQVYAAKLAASLGHADRAQPFLDYCVGLLTAEGRHSVEPLAALTAPQRTAAQHQSLLHLVGKSPWSDTAVLSLVRELVLPAVTRDASVQAFIVDDTTFPKKGEHSVGVARQYCGQLGKQENCQAAVSLSLATHAASLPIAYQLYLPKEWAADTARRGKAGVPNDVVFKTKPRIALEQIAQALADGVPPAVVLADAGYGNDSAWRAGLGELGLTYAVGIQGSTTVWRPGEAPLPPPPWSGRGRPPKRVRRDAEHQPVSVKELAKTMPAAAWQTISWREGSNTKLAGRFARLRVRPAHDDARGGKLANEEWLMIEWPQDADEPDHYWLSTLPADIGFEAMVDRTKLRWRIERDYLELKQEVGLGHFEGRGWRGFHHHATLCIAAYGFLICERQAFPPSSSDSRRRGKDLTVSKGYRPRGSPASLSAPCAQLDRHPTPAPGTPSGGELASVSVLWAPNQGQVSGELVTQ
jgi:SRSO17 transposase